MKRRYRFFDPVFQCWLGPDLEPTNTKKDALLFTHQNWEAWGKEQGFVLNELPEDEKMAILGAPRLPGLDGPAK